MPALYLYLRGSDVQHVLDWLSKDDEIAFLLPAGDRRWRATASIDNRPDGDILLWHIPSGALPLLGPDREPHGIVPNPFAGWVENSPGAKSGVPYIGLHPGVLEFGLWQHGSPFEKSVIPESAADYLGVSSFGWVGNRYESIGLPAAPSTGRWWRRLTRWVKKTGVAVPGAVPVNSPTLNLYAFPEAMSAIISGAPRYVSRYRPVR